MSLSFFEKRKMGDKGDGKWHTEEDFERDFWAAAKYNKYTNLKKTQSPSPLKPAISPNQPPHRKNNIKSIYFDPELNEAHHEDEDDGQLVYRLPSRGRLMNPKLRRPGGKISDSEFYKEVHSSIRQVQHIIGYMSWTVCGSKRGSSLNKILHTKFARKSQKLQTDKAIQ